MALGRLTDLRSGRSLRLLTWTGALAALAGYGASWLTLDAGGGAGRC